jgi:ABC-type ATPase involved in cell division
MDELQMIALEKMFAGENVFLSGTGGTGKSAVIRIFLENSPQNIDIPFLL